MDGGGRFAEPLKRFRRRPAGRLGLPCESTVPIGLKRAFRRLPALPIAAQWRLARGAGTCRRRWSWLVRQHLLRRGARRPLPIVLAQLKDARDVVANAAGFRIADLSITGRRQLSETRTSWRLAEVTARTSLLFLDVERPARPPQGEPMDRRGHGAEALSRPAADRDRQEREAFALWQKDGEISVIAADGTVLAPLTTARFAALPLVVGPGAEKKAKDFLALLDRYPDDPQTRCAPAILVANRRWNLKLKNGIDVRLPEADAEQGAGDARRARPRQADAHPRHHGGRSAAARPGDRAAVGFRRAGARRADQGQEGEAQGGRRMSPRPWPGPQDEAAVAQALGPGRRARHRHQQDRLPDRAAAAAHPAGAAAPAHARGRDPRHRPYPRARHQGGHRRRSRRGRGGDAPRRRLPPSAWPASSSNSSWCRCRPAGSRARLFTATVHVGGHDGRARRDIERVLAARQPAFAARRPRRCCTRCRSAMRSTMRAASAIRAACWASGSASTCMWSPPMSPPLRNLMLASSIAISPSRRWWRAPMWRASRCSPTTRPTSARR